MLRINTPTVSNAKQTISLGGESYTFYYRFNEFNERWYLDIYQNEVPVILGICVIENQSLIRNRHAIDAFSHGDIQCHRILKNDLTPCSRDNLGVGKTYELIYFSNSEIGL